MKRFTLASFLVVAVLLSTATAFAQQAQRINYRITNYFNVAPDKAGAMLDDARTSGRKLIQEEIASGVNITSWVLLRTAFRGVTPAINYNYAISVDFDGAPQTPNVSARDQAYRKATGMSFQDYTQKVNALRANVGSVLYRIEAAATDSIRRLSPCALRPGSLTHLDAAIEHRVASASPRPPGCRPRGLAPPRARAPLPR